MYTRRRWSRNCLRRGRADLVEAEMCSTIARCTMTTPLEMRCIFLQLSLLIARSKSHFWMDDLLPADEFRYHFFPLYSRWGAVLPLLCLFLSYTLCYDVTMFFNIATLWETVATVFMKLSESKVFQNRSVKFARWHHPAVGRGTRFDVPDTIGWYWVWFRDFCFSLRILTMNSSVLWWRTLITCYNTCYLTVPLIHILSDLADMTYVH